jgi:hypothetical protein
VKKQTVAEALRPMLLLMLLVVTAKKETLKQIGAGRFWVLQPVLFHARMVKSAT